MYKGDKDTISFYGRNEDYQELREKDMRLNRKLVEEEKANSPCISDLNFKHKTIGGDETGKSEVFRNMAVCAWLAGDAFDRGIYGSVEGSMPKKS